MSVDTKLYISNRYEVSDIKTIMEKHLNIKDARIDFHNHTPQMFTINFTFNKIKRMMFVHTYTKLPTGPCILLSLGANEDATMIMKSIANVIGGLFVENDCSGNMQIISGAASEEDGIDYFLKWSHLNNKIPGGTIKELNKAIHEWHDDVKGCDIKRMGLFPRK